MPLDPSIPLMGRPPAEPPDYVAQYGQMVSLANLIRQSKMQQQMAPLQMQAAQEEAEMRQMQLAQAKRQQALQESDFAAYHDAVNEAPEGSTLSDLPKTKAWRRISLQNQIKIQAELDAHKLEALKLPEAEIKLRQARNDEYLHVVGGMNNQQDLVRGVNQLVQNGDLPAEEGAQMVRDGFSPENKKRWNTRGKTSAMIGAEAKAEQELETAKAAGRTAIAEAGIKEAQLRAMKNPPTIAQYNQEVDDITKPYGSDPEAVKAANAAKANLGAVVAYGGPKMREDADAIIRKHREDLAAMGRTRAGAAQRNILAIERDKQRYQAGGLIPTGDTGGLTVDDVPASIRPQVENALKYQSALPPQSRLNPAAQAIRWWTMKLDPNYSEDLFPARKAAVANMSSGKMGQQLTNANVVLGHVGRLIEAGEALRNGDLKALNGIANEMQVQTGNSAPTVFRTIVHRIGPELTQAYVGSGGEASERKEVGGDFDVNGSPNQIIDAAKVTAKLLSSKMGGTLFQFKRAAHFAPDDPRGKEMVKQFFTPEAIDVMNNLFPGWERGVEPGGGGRGGGTPTPVKQQFSKRAYTAAHPDKDLNDAIKRATAKGYEVID